MSVDLCDLALERPDTELDHGTEVDVSFVSAVLAPYRLHCRYLKRAAVVFDGEPSWETMAMHGEFAIDKSCYIDDTGHFNAVEFNICYNQLAYVHLAYCIDQKLLPALAAYDYATFQQKQLANFLIVNINSSYYTQLNPRQFFGRVTAKSALNSTKFTILKTACRFYDGGDGRSDGEVKLVVLKP